MTNIDTTIIGAGPIGSYLGYLLSKKGISNTIVEEHSKIGKPEQCTGLISRNIEGLVNPQWFKKAILNKVHGAVISCGRESFEVRTKDFKAYVFDRQKFDNALADRANNSGSELLLNHRYVNHSITNKGLKIELNLRQKTNYLQSSILVGADGPSSKVAKNSSLYGNRKFLVGKQVVLKTKKPFFQKDMVYLFLDKKYSQGFFAWVVPIDENKAKVGVASVTKTSAHLNRFLKDKFDNFIVQGKHAGMIPVYQKIPLQNKERNVFLVGDAALQCKATTGGGIVNGMIAARELSEAIAEGDLDYEKRIGKVRRNLWMHSLIRKKADGMDDARKKALLKDLSHENVKKVLREKGDMDFVWGFGLRVLVVRHGLVRYLF
ncbi:geranylgeranyl reductase family protein [candidate division KSB1 bacterium]